ncbi:MAG TPA: TonB-dependent receptor, partial [Hyphomicrobiales bacterium]|nr:TonB-dependent receptor [Hyphomicrobiales bacterium]
MKAYNISRSRHSQSRGGAFPAQRASRLLSHPFKTLALAVAASTLSLPALAQEGGRGIEEIVVTSSRVPVPLRQIGTSVSVITEDEILAHGNLSISDVLRQMPAIAASNTGGAGKATSVRIRGEEGFRTLTIFDGMRLSDPSGTQIGPQMEHLMSSGIGRVEVLRGPQGLSYGADAGGVINISSRQSGQGFNGSLDAQAGRFGTEQYSGNVAGANERADFFVSASRYETDGFNTQVADNVLADDDGYENTTLHGRFGVDLNEHWRAELVHRQVDGETEFDGCFLTTTVHDCLATYDMKATRAALDYTSDSFSHSFSYAITDTDRDNLSEGISTFASKGELERWEYVGSARELPGFDLVYGADLERTSMNDQSRDNVGYYVEALTDFSDQLFLTAGVRHDDNDDFGTNNSYRVSGAYLIDLDNSATLKFKSSYGTGFRAPSPYEIQYNAGDFAYPPASLVKLNQEKSRGAEAGVEYFTDAGLHLELVYFNQEVKDAIYFDLETFSGYLQDVGTSRSRGVEFNSTIPVGESLELRGNYTYNDT